jgi:hypothetical protein
MPLPPTKKHRTGGLVAWSVLGHDPPGGEHRPRCRGRHLRQRPAVQQRMLADAHPASANPAGAAMRARDLV